MNDEKKLRRSAVLILAGLAVEAASLLKVHPMSFLGFAGVGGLLIVLGILFFLLQLLRGETPAA